MVSERRNIHELLSIPWFVGQFLMTRVSNAEISIVEIIALELIPS
jgi:hypothetical protein